MSSVSIFSLCGVKIILSILYQMIIFHLQFHNFLS